MRVHAVVILLVVGMATCAVRYRGNQIPPRCREASVTPVSCTSPAHDNLLPHPDDCELFYYCVEPDSQPICRQCPAHLHFNPHLHVCDSPDAAGCQLRNSTNTPAPAVAYAENESETFTATTGEPVTETAS